MREVLSGAVLRRRMIVDLDELHLQFLSRSTLQLLVERDLAIRESRQLVLPSKVPRDAKGEAEAFAPVVEGRPRVRCWD
jgi:hypothetical protein